MNLFNKERFDLDRTVRLVINIVIILGVIWLINTLKGVLLPFLVGCLIAYILEPFLQYNKRLLHLKGRVSATLVTLFELTFFLVMVLYFLIPMIVDEAGQMAAVLKRYATSRASVPFLPEGLEEFLRRNIDLELIASKLSHEEWTRMIEEALTASWSVITGSISILFAVFSWVVVALYVVFVMIDYDRLASGFRRMIMPRYREMVFKIGGDIKRSMNQYFRGQALVAFCVGILFCIGFLIVGIPMAIVLGLFIGILNMVPYLQLVSFIPTTFICLVYSVGTPGVDFWPLWWECFAVYCVVQVIQDLYLTPRIIGKAMSLNPALIFLSLSIWGTLMGFIGLIIAIPLTTLLLSYYEKYIISPREQSDESNA